MEHSSLSLPQDVRVELDAAAEAGGYQTSVELIRDMLADYRERRQALAKALDEAHASGYVPYDFDAIMSEARARYHAR